MDIEYIKARLRVVGQYQVALRGDWSNEHRALTNWVTGRTIRIRDLSRITPMRLEAMIRVLTARPVRRVYDHEVIDVTVPIIWDITRKGAFA